MALIVETGSGNNLAANSYSSLVEIHAYNTLRNRVLDATNATTEGQAILAMDYIESFEPQMYGYRTFGIDQPLSWPRENVVIHSDYIENDEIPQLLKNAQAELVYQISSGITLMPTRSEQVLKRRKTGPLEKEFFPGQPSVHIPAVLFWLQPLLFGDGFSLRTVRI